jgi:peptide deformylase
VAEQGQVRDDNGRDAEREARRRLALARIRQYGDPALRLRAGEVETFDEDLGRLIEGMTALMHDANGVGLAGNQVGVLRRVFVFTADEEDHALVNPVLVESSDETEVDDEGCLSLQGVLVPVERPARVTLEGRDAQGRAARFELSSAAARVVQHELDHLDGVLIIDRTTPAKRREAMKALRPRPLLSLR